MCSLLLSFLVREERVAALEAVRKTAKEQVSVETQRTSEQTPEFAESLIEIARIRETLPRKNLDIRSPTVPNVFAGPTLLFRATTKLNGLQVCLGGLVLGSQSGPLRVPRQLQSATGVGIFRSRSRAARSMVLFLIDETSN